MGDFNLQKLPSRRLQTLWEWKNRVLLEEYHIFNVVIPPKRQRTGEPGSPDVEMMPVKGRPKGSNGGKGGKGGKGERKDIH